MNLSSSQSYSIRAAKTFFGVFVCVIFYFPIINHFENGAYILDSGWFAYLFELPDYRLPNPKIINSNSFYDHHISPIFYIYSYILDLFNLSNGIYAFSSYISISIGLLWFFFYTANKSIGNSSTTSLIKIVTFSFLFFTNEFHLRSLGYPHYEILTIALSYGAFICINNSNIFGLFIITLFSALVREDSPLYISFAICTALAIIFYRSGTTIKFFIRKYQKEILLLAFSLILFLILFILKTFYFNKYPTFSSNFSGEGFIHINVDFLISRIRVNFLETGLGLFLVALFVISIGALELLIPFLLLTPLLTLHLIAVRNELGEFALYYGLPVFLLIIISSDLIIRRFQISQDFFRKSIEVCRLSLLLIFTSVFLSHGLGQRNSKYVLDELLLNIPNFKISNYRETIRVNIQGRDNVCASVGVLALNLKQFNDINDFLTTSSPDKCELVILFENDIEYSRSLEKLSTLNYYKILTTGKLNFFKKE